MENEQYYKISANQVNSLLNYLKGKPYIEVWQGMNMLQTLPLCVDPKQDVQEELKLGSSVITKEKHL